MDGNIPERMGDRIRLKREKKGMTQQELADKFKVKRQTVSYWETDTRSFSLDILKKLAVHLDTTCDYILLGQEPNNVTVSNELGLNGDAIKALQFAVEAIRRHEQDDNPFDIEGTFVLQYAENTIECVNMLLGQNLMLSDSPLAPFLSLSSIRIIDLIMDFIRCDILESERFDLLNKQTERKEMIRGSDILSAKLVSIQQGLERLRKSKLPQQK